MPGDSGGVLSGTLGLPLTLCLLSQTKDERSCGWIIRGGIQSLSGGETGGPVVTHYFQCGGGRSGASLDLVV